MKEIYSFHIAGLQLNKVKEVWNLPAINAVRPVVLRIIDHVRFRVCDKSKSTRSLGFRILHNNDIYDFTPFLEVRFQRFVGGSVVETTDEYLPVHLGLILKVGRGVNKMADSELALIMVAVTVTPKTL